jgi:hypothetical protein
MHKKHFFVAQENQIMYTKRAVDNKKTLEKRQ